MKKTYIKGIKNNNQIEFETIKRIRNNFEGPQALEKKVNFTIPKKMI